MGRNSLSVPVGKITWEELVVLFTLKNKFCHGPQTRKITVKSNAPCLCTVKYLNLTNPSYNCIARSLKIGRAFFCNVSSNSLQNLKEIRGRLTYVYCAFTCFFKEVWVHSLCFS